MSLLRRNAAPASSSRGFAYRRRLADPRSFADLRRLADAQRFADPRRFTRPRPARRLAARAFALASAATLGPMVFPLSALAGTEAPAGGAATREVIIASLMVGVVFSALVIVAMANRAGRVRGLDRLAAFAGRVGHLPGWVALPSAVLIVSLSFAVFGLYWDISLHLYNGRDAGPLANPSHYFILIGLLGSFSAGVLAMTLPTRGSRPSPFSVRLADDWHAPLGGVLIAVSAAFGLAGFPLDDLWHRLFGQDVTLWGPTHLLMLAGASLTLIGQAVLLIEGVRASALDGSSRRIGTRADAATLKARRAGACGGILVALSIYQGEFDFGIPQFQLVFHPILIMVAAGVALTLARVWAGRGGALVAVGLYLFVRTTLVAIVSGALDKPVAHFPLYVGAALAVEAVGLVMAGGVRTRPMQFAAVAGLAIGTVGLAAEWAWSHVWMVFPWPGSLWPEGAVAGLVAAVAGSYIGAWTGNSLGMRPRLTGVSKFAPVAGALAIAVLVGYGLNEAPRRDLTATATTQTVETGKPGRWVTITARLNSTYFDTDAKWTQALAWQGPGYINTELERIAPATYRTREPLPASGAWKTVLRFHKDNSLMALPVYEPRDDAIPKPETPAPASFTRKLRADRAVLQRESKIEGQTLPMIGYLTMLTIALTLLALLGWGIWRVGQPDAPDVGSTAGPRPHSGRGHGKRHATMDTGGAPVNPRAA